MKKQVKKRQKNVTFEGEIVKNGGSVGKLYFNSDGGMQVGGG